MPRRITISKGLDLPISGKPKQSVEEIADVRKVAILARDYVGMKPTMMVTEGDVVKVGQPLFEDKPISTVVNDPASCHFTIVPMDCASPSCPAFGSIK